MENAHRVVFYLGESRTPEWVCPRLGLDPAQVVLVTEEDQGYLWARAAKEAMEVVLDPGWTSVPPAATDLHPGTSITRISP